MPTETRYDAIVVGARCAGSPTAMLLARQGTRSSWWTRTNFRADASIASRQAGLRWGQRIQMQCERCGAGPAGADLFDRCAHCGQKLCDECMAAGCCGRVPAASAREEELANE